MLGIVKEEVSRSGLLAKVGAALMTGALKRLRKRIDYAEHGGAPLLGVDGVALICHGGSSATAIQNAVYIADRFAQIGLGKELAAAVARHTFVAESASAATPGAEAIP
jgi:glycerol-3-phosphate acyltransferase PlsX